MGGVQTNFVFGCSFFDLHSFALGTSQRYLGLLSILPVMAPFTTIKAGIGNRRGGDIYNICICVSIPHTAFSHVPHTVASIQSIKPPRPHKNRRRENKSNPTPHTLPKPLPLTSPPLSPNPPIPLTPPHTHPYRDANYSTSAASHSTPHPATAETSYPH